MDYCDFSLSWPSSPDVRQFAISYSVAEENGEVNLANIPPFDPNAASCLTITPPSEGPSDPCMATLTCCQESRVTIRAVQVVSESRTLELFEPTQGYLQTARGSLLQSHAQERGDNPPKLYQCQCFLGEPLQHLSFRFLSLGEQSSFTLHRLYLVLVRGAASEGEANARDGLMSIHSGRLRRHVEGLGDQVSDKALSLLDTLEQYKKNQHGALHGMRQMLTQSSLPPDKQASLAGMMSIFSRVGTLPGAPQTSGSQAQPPPVAALLSQLGASSLGSGGAGGGSPSGSGSQEAFNFMQSICSQVTKMRSNPAPSPAPPEHTNGSVGPVAGLEAFLEKKLREAENRVMAHVDTRIRDVETRLSNKLDSVIALLQDLSRQRSFSPQSSPDSGSQSLPDLDAARNGVDYTEDAVPPALNGHSLQGPEDAVVVNEQEDLNENACSHQKDCSGQPGVEMPALD